jgi:hypothetical protein
MCVDVSEHLFVDVRCHDVYVPLALRSTNVGKYWVLAQLLKELKIRQLVMDRRDRRPPIGHEKVICVVNSVY